MRNSFWLYVSGQTVNLLGDGFGLIAMGWLIYDLTGSKLATGSLFMVALVAEVAVRLVGAPLIDRVDRTRLMAVLDLVRGLAYAAVPLLALSGHLAVWHLYALYLVTGCCGALYMPARLALVPSLVDQPQLIRANALLDGISQAARVVGPLMAGVVIGQGSAHTALLINAVSFFLTSLLTLMLPRVAPTPRTPNESYFGQLTQGFRFFAQVPALLVLTLLFGVVNMGSWAIFSMHSPYVVDHLNAGVEVAGAMQGSWPIGFVVGTAVAGVLGDVRQRRLAMLGSLVVTGLALAGLALVPPGQVPLALACKVLEGASIGVYSATSTTLFQRLVPGALMGRVMAVRLILSWGANSVGVFLGTALAESFSLQVSFLVAGLTPAMLALAAFALPRLRQVDGEIRPVQTAA